MVKAATTVGYFADSNYIEYLPTGFHVYPVLNEHAFSANVSPFLMLDYGSPKQFPVTSKKLGVGQHRKFLNALVMCCVILIILSPIVFSSSWI
jgi:hypothetical protein